jgi:hypothetical protein
VIELLAGDTFEIRKEELYKFNTQLRGKRLTVLKVFDDGEYVKAVPEGEDIINWYGVAVDAIDEDTIKRAERKE